MLRIRRWAICRSGPRRALAGTLGISAGVSANPAWSHGFGERYDLPMPLGYFLAGAAAAVALSFIVVAFCLRRRAPRGAPRLVLDQPRIVRQALRLVARALRPVSVVMFGLVVAAGALGDQGPVHNIAPVAVWVVWWVGFSFLCAFGGNLWPLVNPWDALFVWGSGLARRAGLIHRPSFGLRYPRKLGAAPAVLMLVLFVLAELAWAGAEVPRLLAAALVAYGVLTWAGMAAFGRRVWLAHGEVFSLYFAVLGRFAPLGLVRLAGRRALALRCYAIALVEEPPRARWFTGLVIVMLASVTFDGLSETPLWADLAAVLGTSAIGAAAGPAAEPVTIALGWLAFLAFFALLYGLFMRTTAFTARVSGDGASAIPSGSLARRFALTLVPIAIAYQLAHYLSFILLAGQYAIPLLSDPLGRGWDLFGTALYRVDVSVFDAQFVWYLALAAIVLGHVTAVALGHMVAFKVFGSQRTALRSQFPMLIFMLAYTMSSLWILAQPIVRTR